MKERSSMKFYKGEYSAFWKERYLTVQMKNGVIIIEEHEPVSYGRYIIGKAKDDLSKFWKDNILSHIR